MYTVKCHTGGEDKTEELHTKHNILIKVIRLILYSKCASSIALN